MKPIKKTRNRERVIIRKFEEVPIIDPLTYYTTNQILRLWFIPWLKEWGYWRHKLYWIMLYNTEDSIRYPHEETTKINLKTINWSNIGSKNAKWKVQGMELIKFLKLNNALPK